MRDQALSEQIARIRHTAARIDDLEGADWCKTITERFIEYIQKNGVTDDEMARIQQLADKYEAHQSGKLQPI